MDNQDNRPNCCNQICHILSCVAFSIFYGAFWWFDCLFPGLSFLLRKLYNILCISSSVKVHMLVAGQTLQAHETFMKKLKLQIELCSAESSSVNLVFCPVVSRIGTDMEAAMARVTDNKPVILVFMHHCHDPSYMTNTTVQPSSNNVVQIVHCAFHESHGLVQCTENKQAVAEVNGPKRRNQIYNILIINAYIVYVHMLVAGETFQAHDTFMKKMKLQIDPCSAENSNVNLVFCPVVSRIGTDMKAAMEQVTDNKPIILVFMHHCHDPSYITNTTVQQSSNNIVKIVHCAFHESHGLVQCTENEQAVAEVRSMLLTYKQRNRPSKGETII